MRGAVVPVGTENATKCRIASFLTSRSPQTKLLHTAAAQRWNIRSLSRPRLRRRHFCSASSQPTDVFVLDFDGVMCNSEPEVSYSGYRCAARYWPEVFAGTDLQTRLRVLAALARVRSVLVKGFETMIMARLLLEDPRSEDHILRSWETLLPASLEEWRVEASHIAAFSDGYRNASLLKDRHAWTHRNQLYMGIYEALHTCSYPWYVASSKAAHRVSSLMGSLLGIHLEPTSPRLIAGLIPPSERKIDALRKISQRPLVRDSGARLHFVDDRFQTLKAIQQTPDLSSVQLYLADWGYNLEEERRAAAAMPGIRVITLPQCCELLKWGIIMEVDDGCEPTPEEVVAGVGRR